MFSFAYISALVGTVAFGAIQVIIYTHPGRFYGRTLSEWIDKTRHKADEYSAERLIHIRKRLEVFAHDVLKHRLLGLASLIQELRQETQDGKTIHALSQERTESISAEIFRLCGIKLNAEERLWTRSKDCFIDIYRHTSIDTAVPPLDPMFSKTFRELMHLRSLIMGYVDREGSRAEFLERIMHLKFEECIDLYPQVLALVDACRMVIEPSRIVSKAIDAAASQMRRANLPENITIYGMPKSRFLCPAAEGTITMFLTRLIDNALETGEKAGVSVELDTDEFTGTSSILFKVYDQSEKMPSSNEYGMGIRGIKQRIHAFEGGFQYRLETRDSFRKAAIFSFPVSEYSDFTKSHLKPVTIAAFGFATIFFAVGFIFCLLYVLGGPPVEFAGRGQNITEFRVSVGDELVIPLCKGGRNVRAEIHLATESCVADSCSFDDVLQSLEPCAQSIDDPLCPGEIRWTPAFEDGLRHGKNYELTIQCISDGPPSSRDEQRIRVLVSRKNSPPSLLLTRLMNQTRGEIFHVLPGQTIKTGVSDKLILQVMATDDDADVIRYTLHLPSGATLQSTNGTFELNPSWSQFGTATFELEFSDLIAPSKKIPFILEADELHPIDLKSLALWSNDSTVRHPCDGSGESQICHLPNPLSNVLEMQLWFDPIQQSIKPKVSFGMSENQDFMIRPMFVQDIGMTRPGDQWEIYLPSTQQMTGVLEITSIEKLNSPGLYSFRFSLLTMSVSDNFSSIALNLNVREQSGRLPPLKTILLLTRHTHSNTNYLFSSQHLELTEYDDERDAADAHNSLWIYPSKSGRSAGRPVIRHISCITPEFEKYLDKPVITDLKNAWRIDFGLKSGCIPGLSQSIPGKSRICTADIGFEEEGDKTDPVWIMLNHRSCAPKIESLSLVSTKEELNNNIFRWNFSITDPDGDLPLQNIDLSEKIEYAMLYDTQSSDHGNTYSGTLTIRTSCDNPLFLQGKPGIFLSVVDRNDHETRQRLTATENCPPLVATKSLQTRFTVSAGERLIVPLTHPHDVHLTLNHYFGNIRDDSFVWDANCLYGQGPHTISISGESKTHYGRPLAITVFVEHCQPHFDLSLNSSPIFPSTPLLLASSQENILEIAPSLSVDDVAVLPQSQSDSIAVTTLSDDAPWRFKLQCLADEVESNIDFNFSVPEGQPPIDAIHLKVRCAGEK